MKPIALFGHERSVTQIRYNREGDLLFTVAKDTTPNIWYSINGERLGTFDGHGGACWCVDVNWDTSKAITGSADNTFKIWDVQTGKCTSSIEYKSAVRTNGFSYSGNLVFTSTDRTMGQTCDLCVYDIRDGSQIENNAPHMRIPMESSKITAALWTHHDDVILTGHENGELNLWDVKMQDTIGGSREIHKKQINDIQKHSKLDMVVTASKDCTAKLIELPDLTHFKTYKTERPVNSAALSPLRDHVLMGGGQEAMDVTTTSGRVGKFDATLFHSIFEEEFGKVKGHFGPINSVAFHPDGMGYSSGGEDGYVRIHSFDTNYFEFEVEY